MTGFHKARVFRLFVFVFCRKWTVSISGDGRTLCTGGEDKLVRVWDVETRRLQASLRGHTSWVLTVSLAHNGVTCASGGGDGTVRVWDAVKGGECVHTLTGHAGPVRSVRARRSAIASL